jgi:regulator of sigma E protease
LGMCLIAAVGFASVLYWTGIVIKVAIGLGAVIFVHELGHFLVAKACGVKCEKFFLGFDIAGYKISHRWGETEYGIGILPLGGYVKMLGQDDDPSHLAEQMKESQVDASSTDAVAIVGPDGEQYYVDRRSYLAKSVPQRMAIISAGVVMNVIFAFLFAVVAYGMGVPYMPCIVSETIPGSPAWQADVRPGDEIVRLGNQVDPTFTQLLGGVTLGNLQTGISCVIRREATGKDEPLVLKPEQSLGRPTIGIAPPRSLVLLPDMPTYEDSPAARAKLVNPPDMAGGEQAHFEGGDRIVRVGDVPVEDYEHFSAELARQASEPLLITVQRAAAADKPADVKELTFKVSANPMRRFGLVMKMGPIDAVQANSPAEGAGLVAGDFIEKVDSRPMAGTDCGNFDSWDAVSLPEYLRKAAADGREVELTILRKTAGAAEPRRETIRVTPRMPTVYTTSLPPGAPLGADALGIAYDIENEVEAVLPGSPAAVADQSPRPGDKITSAKLILPADTSYRGTIDTVPFSPQQPNWPMLLDAVQSVPDGTQVKFTIEREGAEPYQLKLTPHVAEGLFSADRGFGFKPIERIRRAGSFADQVVLGWNETVDSLTMVFRFLEKIGTQVPITALGGPVTIARAAGYYAEEGIAKLLVFLTMLSANLAVLNFLPIPLLDGGHMVFLAWEGIRGRPASEKFVIALHTAGFIFIVSLMLFVIALDLNIIPRGIN